MNKDARWQCMKCMTGCMKLMKSELQTETLAFEFRIFFGIEAIVYRDPATCVFGSGPHLCQDAELKHFV